MRDSPLRRCNELGQPLACIEHARLDRGLGDAGDIGDLFHRFAVVVDEVEDLTMLRRQAGQGFAQQFAPLLLLRVSKEPRRTVGGLDGFCSVIETTAAVVVPVCTEN